MSGDTPMPAKSEAASDGGGVVRYVRHKKRGTVYRVLGEGRVQTEEPIHDYDHVVIYQGEDGKIWVRHPDEFGDGRFEDIPTPSPPEARATTQDAVVTDEMLDAGMEEHARWRPLKTTAGPVLDNDELRAIYRVMRATTPTQDAGAEVVLHRVIRAMVERPQASWVASIRDVERVMRELGVEPPMEWKGDRYVMRAALHPQPSARADGAAGEVEALIHDNAQLLDSVTGEAAEADRLREALEQIAAMVPPGDPSLPTDPYDHSAWRQAWYRQLVRRQEIARAALGTTAP